MHTKITVMVISILLSGAAFVHPQEIWVSKDGNIRNVDTRAMFIDGGGLYLATKKEIYHAQDISQRWEEVFSLPAGENEIKCIAGWAANILAGTKKGLFRSQDSGRSWRSVFRTIVPDKSSVLCMELSKYNPKKVLIGTEKGIFMSEDLGDRWIDISANLKNKPIKCIALAKESVYAGGDNGLYIKKNGSDGWERIYVSSAAEKNSNEEVTEPAETEEENVIAVNCIMLKNSIIYIGIDKRILYSSGASGPLVSFPSEGLSGTVNYIVAPKDSSDLYCATTKGVFEFVEGKARWLELYKGTDKVLNVNRVVFDENENSLWALTEKGVYKMERGRYVLDQRIDVEKNLKAIKVLFENEPAFKELQQAAMRFAELDPEKIRSWRNQARLKALFPKITFGVDDNRSTNSEIYTSATKDYITVGPDDVSRGIDLSVSWELGDMIWSDAQTSIDVRSRLTTQLRNDILDDLRRAYYERRRLQFELMESPPKDLRIRFEKDVRLQELTQAIDDLTGNYLSEHIERPQNI